MLPDPLSITFSGSAVSLPRITVSGGMSIYESNDGSFRLTIMKDPDSDTGIQETLVRLYKRSDDTNWADGYTPLSISVSGGVGVNAYRYDESSRAALKTALDGFISAYSSRLVVGEQ